MRRTLDTTTWSDGSTTSTDRPSWLAALARHRTPCPLDPEAPAPLTASAIARGGIRAVAWVAIVAAKVARDLALVLAGLAGAALGIGRDIYDDSFGS